MSVVIVSKQPVENTTRTYHSSFHRSTNKLILQDHGCQERQTGKGERNADRRNGPLDFLGLVRDVTFKVAGHGDQSDDGKGRDGEPMGLTRAMFFVMRHGELYMYMERQVLL